jgi:hypothetical protein
MDRPSFFSEAEIHRHHGYGCFRGWAVALFLCSVAAAPGFSAQIPVRDGQTVIVKLRNVLTTDNCRKNDVIAFEVADDVLVNGHVVIAKGAPALGKVTDIKGAFKPRDKGAEVSFKFLTVRAVDDQNLPLRIQPGNTHKGKDEEVRERSVIPGQITRVVGADKGKEYTVYVDGSFTVVTSNAIAMTPEVSPAAAAVTQPGAPVTTPAAPAPAPAPLTGTDMTATSSVEFDSTPDGADIVVDGNLLGNTHSTLHLTPGHHDLEIRIAGYRTWTRRMVVDPESHQSVRVTLIPQ